MSGAIPSSSDVASDERFGPRVLSQLRPTRWPVLLAMAVALGGAGVLRAGLANLKFGPTPESATPLLVGLGLLVFGIAGASILWLVRSTMRRQVTVEANGGRLVVDGSLVAVSGVAPSASRDGSWRVAVYDGGRHPAATFVVATRDEAEALARAATMATGAGLAVFRLPFYESQLGSRIMLAGLAASVACLALFHRSAWAWPALFGSIASMAPMLAPLRVTLGNDALHLAWFRWNWYVPLAEVAEASVDSGRLVLRLRSGQSIRLGVRHRGPGLPETTSFAAARRVTALLDSAPAGDEAEGLLAQGTRSTSDWFDALRALRVEHYRIPVLDARRLWSMLEHPRTSLSARIGAAFLLAGGLDAEGKARMRALERRCVVPQLRRRLEEAASSDPLAAIPDP